MKGTEADAKETYDRLTFDLAEAEKELAAARSSATKDTAKIDRLTSEVKSLTGEKTTVEAKLAAAKDDVARLTYDLAEAEKELVAARSSATKDTAKIDKLTAEVKSLTGGKKTAEDKAAAAKDDVARLTFDLAEAEKELVAARSSATKDTAKIDKLTAEVKSLTGGKKTAEDKAAAAKDDVARLTFDLAEAEKELVAARSSATKDTAKIDKLTAEVKSLTGGKKTAEDKAAAAKDDVARLTFDLAEAEKELVAARSSATKDTAKIDKLTAEVKSLTGGKKTAEDKAAAAKDDVARLTFDLAEAEKELVAARSSATKDTAKIDKLTAEVKSLTGGKKTAEDKAAAAKDDVARLTFDLAEAEKELVAARSSATKDTAKIDKLTAEVSRLTSLLQTPMIRAAYSGMDSAGGARTGVLAGISDPNISPHVGESEIVNVEYGKDHRPKFHISVGTEGAPANVARSVAPIVGGYDGYRFEGETGESVKTHVVLYTDKRDRRVSYVMTGAADDGNVYSDGRKFDEPTEYIRFWEDDLVYGPTEPAPGVGGRYIVKDQTKDGTYDGIAGSYECVELPDDAPGCNINDNVQIGVIKFTPTTPPADDYLTFGVWLTVPEESTDKHPVDAYATGNDPFMGEFAGLTETVTYEGPAVGIYGKRETGSATSKVGSFTAKAFLTAEFGGGWVNGYVTEFKENDDEFGWKVKLLKPFDSIGDAPSSKFVGSGAQISKTGEETDMKGKGAWIGQFYGNGKVTDYPGSVAGTFNAKTGLVDDNKQDFLGIVGAFGAKMKVQPSAQ